MNNNLKRAPTNHDKKKEKMSLRINRVYLLKLCLIPITAPLLTPTPVGGDLTIVFRFTPIRLSPCFISMLGVFHFPNNMQLVLPDILQSTICPPIYVLFAISSSLSLKTFTLASPSGCGYIVYDRDVHIYVLVLFLDVLYDICCFCFCFNLKRYALYDGRSCSCAFLCSYYVRFGLRMNLVSNKIFCLI